MYSVLRLGRTHRTGFSARAAVNTLGLVDHVLAVTGTDALSRALCLASTASDAITGNNVSHVIHLLKHLQIYCITLFEKIKGFSKKYTKKATEHRIKNERSGIENGSICKTISFFAVQHRFMVFL